jgi:Lon protease-like protein
MHPPANLADLPSRVRLFPLGGAILLPRANMPLNIFEPRYLAMVRDAMASDHMVGIIQPRTDWQEDRPELFQVGGLGRITQYSETGDGRFLIVLTGLARFRIVDELAVTTAYRQAEVDYGPYGEDWSPALPLAAAARASVESTLRNYLEAQGLSADWEAVKSADDESLVNTLSVVCPFVPAERQALLEARTLPDRAATLTTLMEFAQGAQAQGASDRTLQ